ncbi:hypothetical protein BGZ51_000810 [Haplosporangium sp. Z 767]|nr:hypothetical protein BGZ51_000810 [Haplosporangium sp. Z 767]KAF9189591.1 hypothetical protein BGZ50_000691 [Haplosporangium sp. Z 11]
MVLPLSRRRKADLKDLAQSLGISDEGIREDLVEKIKYHIATSKDSSLHALIRDDSPDITPPNTTTTSARSSPKKNTEATMTATATKTSSISRRNSVSSLKEHDVREFMEHMQDELHDAHKLAKDLENTLRGRHTYGSSAQNGGEEVLERSHSTQQITEEVSSPVTKKRRHSHSHKHSHQHGHDRGRFWRLKRKVKHHFRDCVGQYSFMACIYKPWKKLHELGSTSTGLVWITLLLELSVFLVQAFAQHQQAYPHLRHHGEDKRLYYHAPSSWFPYLAFLTNWPEFLNPFFSYYGAFFVLPTLLSQLFNVDHKAALLSHRRNDRSRHGLATGLLAKGPTTSALSFFAFKFALTFFLSQSAGLMGLLGGAIGATSKSKGLWSGCKYIAEVFRYIPCSLGLATSGAGTVLSLAESIVSASLSSSRHPQ